MVEDFVYTTDIEEIKPMTLNLTIVERTNKTIKAELRKKFTIDLENPKVWIDLFSASLEGKPIKANIIIAFRNPFKSACQLKQLKLLKPGTKIKLE
jgi:hypothetical protein